MITPNLPVNRYIKRSDVIFVSLASKSFCQKQKYCHLELILYLQVGKFTFMNVQRSVILDSALGTSQGGRIKFINSCSRCFNILITCFLRFSGLLDSAFPIS